MQLFITTFTIIALMTQFVFALPPEFYEHTIDGDIDVLGAAKLPYDITGGEVAKLVKGRQSAEAIKLSGTVQICRQGCTLFDCIQVSQRSTGKCC